MPKISELPDIVPPLAGDELIPIVQDGVTKKIPVEDLAQELAQFSESDGADFLLIQVFS
jgi:hypothetical protein